MNYQEQWDEFLIRFKSNPTVELLGELKWLERNNPVAQRVLEQIAAAYGEKTVIKTPSSWEMGTTHFVGRVYGDDTQEEP